MSGYIVGMDVGKRQDYTAISVVRMSVRRDKFGKNYQHLDLQWLERYPLRTGYVHQVMKVRMLTNSHELHNNHVLVVDITGVGDGIHDIMAEQRINHIPVQLHGGLNETHERDKYGNVAVWRVPKVTLMNNLLVYFERQRFKMPDPAKLPLVETLDDELRNFRPQQNPDTGHMRFEHREGEHDDLVLSAALAAWGAKKFHSVGNTPDLASDTPYFSGNELPFDHKGEMPFSVGVDW